MICQRCRQRLAQRTIGPDYTLPFAQRSSFSQSTKTQSTPVTAETTTATNPRPHGRPAATSTSAAQPFSTPLSPKPARQDLPIRSKQTKQAAKLPQSSVLAGTVLKGLNFMKNQQDPVAMEDHEYPAWLWTALERKASETEAQGTGSEGDLFCTHHPPYPHVARSELRLANMACVTSEIEKATSTSRESTAETTAIEPRIAGAEGAIVRAEYRFTWWRWDITGCERGGRGTGGVD